MRVRYEVPVWALLFSVPVALLVVNCGSANLDTENRDSNIVMNENFEATADSDVALKDMDMGMDMTDGAVGPMTDELNLEEGITDEGRRRWRGRGWGRRGYYRGFYGFGYPYYGYGYGYGYPFYGYGYGYPYYRWWY